MADDFAEHLLFSSLAHMCRTQGWHQASQSGLNIFSAIARHYITQLGILTLKYSLHGERFEPDLDDLGNAFTELGIDLSGLQRFWTETDSFRGLPQVCTFPAQESLNLNIPEAVSPTRPDHIPTHLPSRTASNQIATPEKEVETTANEDSTIVNESQPGKTVDPFDVAAAAPAPSAPNFPFVNKADVHAPAISSWGFQRVQIDPKTQKKPSNPATSDSEKRTTSSPDNFAISENSDDFVFASRHAKVKEEKKQASLEQAPQPQLNNIVVSAPAVVEKQAPSPRISKIPEPKSNHVTNNTPAKKDGGLNDSLFLPSLATSTPLVTESKLPLEKPESRPQNGVSCKQQLFKKVLLNNSSSQNKPSPRNEPLSGKATNSHPRNERSDLKKPSSVGDSDSDEFNDFGFGGSSSDEMTSKENVDRLLKPLSPLDEDPVTPQPPKHIPVVAPLSKSPPSKRRKLESPTSSPNHNNVDKTLLKNRPDLIRNDFTAKPKSECKLLNNHVVIKNVNNNHVSKKHEREKGADSVHIKKAKTLGLSNHLDKSNHKIKKVKKKKDKARSIDLFDESPIKVPNIKFSTPKKTDVVVRKVLAEPKATPTPPSEPKIAPLTLSLPKTELPPQKLEVSKKSAPEAKSSKKVTTDSGNERPVKLSKRKEIAVEKSLPRAKTPPPVSETKPTPSLKISLKSLPGPKSSKYKSKSIIESDDDKSSNLSSDSDSVGFEALLPTKPAKPTVSVKVDKRKFKTKAELKNPCPVVPPSPPPVSAIKPALEPSPPSSHRDIIKKKSKPAPISTKIKIGKSHLTVPQSPNLPAEPKPTIKPTMKLKLPIPPPRDPSPGPPVSDVNISSYSQPSLLIDESFLDRTVIKQEPVQPAIAPLKIPKIKIKIGGSNYGESRPPSSPVPSYSSSSIIPTPEPPIKPLKIKMPESMVKSEPVAASQPAITFHPVPKKKEKKPKKPKPEKKPPKPVEKVAPKVVKEKKIPIILPPTSEPAESPVQSCVESSLISETIVSETVPVVGDTGMKIWICPSCQLPDDGSPMVGCDKCDDWYHWPCVGLVQAPPDHIDWFCPNCNKAKKPGRKSGKRKRKT